MNKIGSTTLIIFGGLLLAGLHASGQTYAPPAGQTGTSAMHKDSAAFVAWATDCQVTRGYQDISNTSLGLASVGSGMMATGKAQANAVVSLGDGGVAICTFEKAIQNGPGFDFAVFENSFSDTFLELAFVEVSSDGINFTRFAAHSLSDTVNQLTNNGSLDATKINNLAGKYRAAYGTPFDLQELAGKPNLDINMVTHVKIIDVVGSLLRAYATYDSFGNKINDPWTTAFPSGGFDLDAIGVIHQSAVTGITTQHSDLKAAVFPNPLNALRLLHIAVDAEILELALADYTGKIYSLEKIVNPDLSTFPAGIYVLKIVTVQGTVTKKIVIE